MSSDQEFSPLLESLRGVAALSVASFHALPFSGSADIYATWDRIYLIGSNGRDAVFAFFVISGLVLTKSLTRTIQTNPAWMTRYYVHRVFRLFPAAVFVICLILAASYAGLPGNGSHSPVNAILNMLMIRTDINPVMWSMKVELIAAGFTPFIVLGAMTYGPRLLFGLFLLLFGVSWSGEFNGIASGTNLAGLYAFVLGMMIHFPQTDLTRKIPARWRTVAAVMAVAVYCYCNTRSATGWTQLAVCLSSAVLIGLLNHFPNMEAFKPLSFRIVRFYGKISYSFYLLHITILAAMTHMFPYVEWTSAPGVPMPIKVAFQVAALIAMTTLPAYLMWRYVEVPGIRAGRFVFERLSRRTRNAGSASTQATLYS